MTVAAVERAFALLQAVLRTDGTLSGLSRETGLAVATVSRLMGTLEQTGAVSRDGKVYRIGPTVLELASAEPSTFDLLSLASGHLNDLLAVTGETAGIAEAIGTDHVHLGQVATTHDVSVRDWTGVRVAAHSGCIGFVMMAYWTPDEIDAYFGLGGTEADGGLERFSPETLTTWAKVEPLLESVRRDGYLWTVDQYAVGVTTVAAPILDRSGAAVASLYVHGPSYRFPGTEQRTIVGEDVAARARAISAVLGHRSEDSDD